MYGINKNEAKALLFPAVSNSVILQGSLGVIDLN